MPSVVGVYPIKTIHMVPDRCRLCKLRYPGHPHGCPNFGKRPDCPPAAPLLHERFDITQPLYLLTVTWNIGKWADHMGELHPNWSERQRYNCLYWQGKVRKILRLHTDTWLPFHRGYEADTCPEALGLDVDKVMQGSAGITLEWPPRKLVRKIAVAGIPKLS